MVEEEKERKKKKKKEAHTIFWLGVSLPAALRRLLA
jgi:hypothetical protein